MPLTVLVYSENFNHNHTKFCKLNSFQQKMQKLCLYLYSKFGKITMQQVNGKPYLQLAPLLLHKLL